MVPQLWPQDLSPPQALAQSPLPWQLWPLELPQEALLSQLLVQAALSPPQVPQQSCAKAGKAHIAITRATQPAHMKNFCRFIMSFLLNSLIRKP
jgi:hypothetical protein